MSFRRIEGWRELNTIELGLTLQRLFSTFPNGWPGFGLLLLRLCLGVALIYFGTADLSRRPSELSTSSQYVFAAIGGIFLLVGLWTPVIGTLTAIDEAWIALSLYFSRPPDTETHVFLAVLSVSVAMLGPGAWSVDARLFGRKRFDIDRSRSRKRSL